MTHGDVHERWEALGRVREGGRERGVDLILREVTSAPGLMRTERCGGSNVGARRDCGDELDGAGFGGDEVEALPRAEGESAALDVEVHGDAEKLARARSSSGTMASRAARRSTRTSGSAFSLTVMALVVERRKRLTTPALTSRISGRDSYRVLVQR